MADLSHKQEKALDFPVRKQVFEFIQKQTKPVSIGSVQEGVEGLRDYAAAFYHVGVLVDAELVEKVWGTNLYRAVGG